MAAEGIAKRLEEQTRKIKAWMGKIRHKIAVLSGKGGVGKSMLAVNMAACLAMDGRVGRVGILDADITGPTIPKMLGVRGSSLVAGPPGIFPAVGPLGIKVVSMDFLLPSDETPVIWRGPMKSMAIRQFLADVVWGELDFLVVDLPPGTGDEALTVAHAIPGLDGSVIVTIPSEVSQLVVKKAVMFSKELHVPVIGVVENMSKFVCPNCGAVVDLFGHGGGEKVAEDLGVEFLGSIPFDVRLRESCDRGVPFVVEYPDSPTTEAIRDVVSKILGALE